MTETENTALTAAINLRLVDAHDLVRLMDEHDGDAAAMLSEIDGFAAADQHSNPAKPAAWFAVRDALCWLNSSIATETEDRFGFKAAARKTALSALAVAGIAQ